MAALANAKVPFRQIRAFCPCLGGTVTIELRVEDGVSIQTIDKRRKLDRHTRRFLMTKLAGRITAILICIDPQRVQDFAQKSG
ncbi:hypothetical protein D3C81_2159600 [compost metagenome]